MSQTTISFTVQDNIRKEFIAYDNDENLYSIDSKMFAHLIIFESLQKRISIKIKCL
ncbi:hypothetical protein ENUP19_0113G0031 [Entamoeba nuttalli]|uniref:Uncharacterized protein n=1 Tax=Entamoeba nuttalli TaxID=412467 RepID=A0ABQ0DI41_9EUKA